MFWGRQKDPTEKPYYRSIVDTLKSVKRPGMYAAGGKLCMPLPAISLTGEPDTILGLPLCEAQAKHLIELASRAPYGRGEQTIVDTSVRCTWQLSPTQFTITNPQWEERLKMVLAKVKNDLGCDSKMKVTCELYKLLLYEPGGHFKKHRDTEKAEGMFGTLVIQLPSNYTGGKLVVYHQGKKSEFDYSGPGCRNNCYFMSFYADCQHEIEEVTKGYRLCLIYNLMYQGIDECPAPADNQKQASAIVSAMKEWQEDIESADCPKLMTYLLEHKYCEASLSFQLLKNVDRAVADVLAQAKAEFDFDFYMGQVSLTEQWSAAHYGRGKYEEIECCDESVSVEYLKACSGGYSLSHIETDKESFVPENFFDTVAPDKEEFEEATGNEGATVDKQYSWAALLLWPIKKRTAVMGLGNMVDMFKQDVDTGKKDLESTAKSLMKEMRGNNPGVQSCLTFLRALTMFADSKLIAEMLDVVAGIGDSYSSARLMEDTTFCNLLLTISGKHGWDILKSPLHTMFARCSSSNVEKYCAFLNRMITSKKPDEEKELYENLLLIIVRVLVEERDAVHDNDSPLSSSMWRHLGFHPQVVYRRKEFVTQLFSLLTSVGSDDLFASTVDALRSKPIRYPILECLGPAIVDLSKSMKIKKDGPLQVILTYCISQLQASLQRVVAVPKTSAKPVKFTCLCNDCAELRNFLMHPTQIQRRFKMGKGRRRHLHQQLDNSGADATHTTEHFGNPHTLVVTKTNNTYQKDLKQQEQERALLASLQSLLAVLKGSSENEPPIKKQKGEGIVASGSSSHVNII